MSFCFWNILHSCHLNIRFSVQFSFLAVSTVPYTASLCSPLEVSEDFERKASNQEWKASQTHCCVTEGEGQAQEESDIQLFLSHFHYHQWWNATDRWQFQRHRHKSKHDPSEAFIADCPEIVLMLASANKTLSGTKCKTVLSYMKYFFCVHSYNNLPRRGALQTLMQYSSA